jgi:hypothetical protein
VTPREVPVPLRVGDTPRLACASMLAAVHAPAEPDPAAERDGRCAADRRRTHRGGSNGGTEAINGVIEKTRRLMAHEFRNFENRLRLLLAANGKRSYPRRAKPITLMATSPLRPRSHIRQHQSSPRHHATSVAKGRETRNDWVGAEVVVGLRRWEPERMTMHPAGRGSCRVDLPAGHRLRECCAPCRCTKGIREVLRLMRHLLASEFHNGNRKSRQAVIRDNAIAHPQIPIANDP